MTRSHKKEHERRASGAERCIVICNGWELKLTLSSNSFLDDIYEEVYQRVGIPKNRHLLNRKGHWFPEFGRRKRTLGQIGIEDGDRLDIWIT